MLKKIGCFTVILVVLNLVFGCSYQYSLQTTGRLIDSIPVSHHYVFGDRRNVNLPISARIYVAIPESASAIPSSSLLTYSLAHQLKNYIPGVNAGLHALTIEEALEQASLTQSDFLLYPEMIKQEEQRSSLSEVINDDESLDRIGLDRIWILVSVWDVNSKVFVDSTRITGRSAPIQFSENHNQDLIAGAMKEYAERLMAKY